MIAAQLNVVLGGVAEGYTATDVTAAARGPSVCVSVTLVHPAKTVGRNEMPFGIPDARVDASNIVLDGVPGPVTPRKGVTQPSGTPVTFWPTVFGRAFATGCRLSVCL